MKHISVGLAAFFACTSTFALDSHLRLLNCDGVLNQGSSKFEKVYYEQDKARYGIDKIELFVESNANQFLHGDMPAHTVIKGKENREVIFPDPAGASAKSTTMKVVRAQHLSRFDYASVWSTPGATKVSVNFFAAVTGTGRGFLELNLTSGGHRRYYYDLSCEELITREK